MRGLIAQHERTVPDGVVVRDYHCDGFLSEVSTSVSSRKRRRVALQLLRDAMGFSIRLWAS